MAQFILLAVQFCTRVFARMKLAFGRDSSGKVYLLNHTRIEFQAKNALFLAWKSLENPGEIA